MMDKTMNAPAPCALLEEARYSSSVAEDRSRMNKHALERCLGY